MPKLDVSQFSVDDFKDMRLVLTKKGRPTSDMTDEIWQVIFNQLKEKTKPYEDGMELRMNSRHSQPITNEWGEFEEDKITDWKRYCLFINAVLDDIRSGCSSLCFYYYQITDLLKYHKNDLKTKYNKKEGYWEVWLDG